jgi:hypothetical protein
VGLAGEALHVADLAEDDRGQDWADAANGADLRGVFGEDLVDAGLDRFELAVQPFDVVGVVERELLARLPDLVPGPDGGQQLPGLAWGEAAVGPCWAAGRRAAGAAGSRR